MGSEGFPPFFFLCLSFFFFVFSFFFAFLFSRFSPRTRANDCNLLATWEFHSNPVCTDPVQNFPRMGKKVRKFQILAKFWPFRSPGRGPCLMTFLQRLPARRGSRTLFQTPSPKVRDSHFLCFGLPELLLRESRSFLTQISRRNFLPELCGEVHPGAAPFQAPRCTLFSTEQSTFRGGEKGEKVRREKGRKRGGQQRGQKGKKDA